MEIVTNGTLHRMILTSNRLSTAEVYSRRVTRNLTQTTYTYKAYGDPGPFELEKLRKDIQSLILSQRVSGKNFEVFAISHYIIVNLYYIQSYSG